MIRKPVSAELELAVQCCRLNFHSCRRNDRALPEREIHWPAFMRIVAFHRIEGLAWIALREGQVKIPADVVQSLSEAAARIATQSLIAAHESAALAESFAAAGVPLLFLKGITLSALAYGNSTLKSAIDIDLLIGAADLGRAADLLRSRGFHLTAPQESRNDSALHAWHRVWKESVWTKQSPAVQIDLHTRAADNPRMIPAIGAHSAHQLVDVGNGIRLPTLATEELFAYLAVHGASSAWFRLKWISDFAALLDGHEGQEIGHLYRRSQDLGSGRSAGLALLLADRLFESLRTAPALREELERDAVTVLLRERVWALLTSPPGEPTERRFGTLPIHRVQFSLMPGLAFKLSEFVRQGRQAIMSRSQERRSI